MTPRVLKGSVTSCFFFLKYLALSERNNKKNSFQSSVLKTKFEMFCRRNKKLMTKEFWFGEQVLFVFFSACVLEVEKFALHNLMQFYTPYS